MTVAGKVKTMKCAYCGRVLPWDEDNYASWLYAECRGCMEAHKPRGTFLRRVIAAFRRPVEVKVNAESGEGQASPDSAPTDGAPTCNEEWPCDDCLWPESAH